MAFNKRTTTNAQETSSTNSEREPRTTIGYVNLSIPLTDGSNIKIAGDLTIRLYAENAGHLQLVQAIKDGHVTLEEASHMIVPTIALARDNDAPVEIDWSRIGK